jgi:ArsR family metal-binding transcriptional regulator
VTRSRERREFIAMHLGLHLLDLRREGKLTMSTVKEAMDKAEAWMRQEDLRDEVAKIIEGGGDTKARLKEILK